jgi:hypothetical protein
MNVLHMPEFYRTLVETGFIGPGEFQINLLFEPECYNVRGLPPSLKARVTESYRAFIDGYLSLLGDDGQRVRGHFEAVLQYMSGGDMDVRDAFLKRTAELDVLRRERFLDVFPELEAFVGSDQVLEAHRAQARVRMGHTQSEEPAT